MAITYHLSEVNKFSDITISFLIAGLADNKTSVEKIEYVVCPYGHVETTGNLNLFPSAIHIVGYSIMKEDKHVTHDFHQVPAGNIARPQKHWWVNARKT